MNTRNIFSLCFRVKDRHETLDEFRWIWIIMSILRAGNDHSIFYWIVISSILCSRDIREKGALIRRFDATLAEVLKEG